ncbi:gamma-glutamylcyclotransferase-like [Microplitis mediator]|uniref:gamma-glutamylcyclotransferase-like n=1 Tax=Microplitis mediator TaxID=375433 RepID=UPI0025525251|nr:gamma-glutamylcyclotransferase-like [Microplitis mediator]
MNTSILVVYYFAYGSNMLDCRFNINIPRAKVVGIGQLENYRLDFFGYGKSWNGSGATIVRARDSQVWGVIWKMPESKVADLDRQEGVHVDLYKAIEIKVTSFSGKVYYCRSYKAVVDPKPAVKLDQLPDNRLPSSLYMKVLIKGAQDHHLPQDYIKFMKTIRHNNITDVYPEGLEACGLTGH